jgi:hypothetical protein
MINETIRYKMKHFFLFFLLVFGILACKSPTELTVPERIKPADKFARNFLKNVIIGQIDSCFKDIDPEVLNDTAKEYIKNASSNINGATVKNYRVIEMTTYSNIPGKSERFTNYRLIYEYAFEKGYILFTLTICEKNKLLKIISFNGELLQAPLSELTKFTLRNKTVGQYCFLIFVILVPLFILTTFISMLLSKISVRQKIIWGLIILAVSLPRLFINWNTGQIDFNIINFSLLGFGFSKPTLYSAWILSFNIPVGSIIFWFRKNKIKTAANERAASMRGL